MIHSEISADGNVAPHFTDQMWTSTVFLLPPSAALSSAHINQRGTFLLKKKKKVTFFHVFCQVTCRNMSFVR